MPSKPVKKQRRFWRRLFRGLLLFSTFGLLLLAGGFWWAYQNRTALVNRALAGLEPWAASVESVEVSGSGDLEIRNFELKDKETGTTLLEMPRASGKVIWTSLFEGKAESVTLEQPAIFLDTQVLKKLTAPSQTSPEVSESSWWSTGFSLGNFEIQDARVRVLQPDKSETEIKLSFSAKDLASSVQGELSTGDQELTIQGNQRGENKSPISLPYLHATGRLQEGIIELDLLSVQNPALRITPDFLTQFGLQTSRQKTEENVTAKTSSPALIKGLLIKKIEVNDFDLALQGFLEKNEAGLLFPNTKGRLTYEAEDISWLKDGATSTGAQKFTAQKFSLEMSDDRGHLRWGNLQLELGAWDAKSALQLLDFQWNEPDVYWTTTLRDLLIPAKSETSKPAEVTANVAISPMTFRIKKASISDAKIVLADTELMTFDLRALADLKLQDVFWDGVKLSSAKTQSLAISEAVLQYPPTSEVLARRPFFELPGGELLINPDQWNENKYVERLFLENPVLRIRESNTPWFDPVKANVTETPAVAPDPTLPFWKLFHFGELDLKDGSLDILTTGTKPVDTQTTLQITTGKTDQNGSLHRVSLQDFEARLPTLSRFPFPVAQAEAMEGVVKMPQLWSEHRLEELHLRGANMEASEAVLSLFETNQKNYVTPVEPPTADVSIAPVVPVQVPLKVTPWNVGHFSVSESSLTIANLIPGLPAVKFGVAFEVHNSPLLPEDLVKDVAPQRIELANLVVPSPYEPLRPVAELNSVFLHFTLDGLMRKEINKVEIISPTLYVGEDLFWYVDYYRKYVANNAISAAPLKQMAVAGEDTYTAKMVESVLKYEPPTSSAAWSVKQFQVHSGKLVLAPKGKPLKGFREPFPFNINTEIVRGTLEAQLEIPSDTYTLDDYKLELQKMKGKVLFNLPLRDRSNNLVETFEVDSIRWKELYTGKAYLTVTYDAMGIYAKFGAEAYEGYINGELNVYIDDSFHWDGWLGGKNIQTKEITEKLCPGYFLIDGRVEATLVAQGSKDELYQADGSFKNHTPGRFSISAFNDLVDKLPGKVGELKNQISQIGLETMRDFAYDSADAQCRFYGREGNGFLRFKGPTGSRNFEINVYDHRWKVDPPPPVAQTEPLLDVAP